MWSIIKVLRNKNWINFMDRYGWFQSYSRYWIDRRLYGNERQITKWKSIVSRLK